MAHSRVEGKLLVTDFRGVDPVPVGSRFLVFALFPQINVALRIQRDAGSRDMMVTLGHSVVDRSCQVNLGELAARYGGGGHLGAASIRLAGDAEPQLRGLVAELSDCEPFDLGELASLPLPDSEHRGLEYETAAAVQRLLAPEAPGTAGRKRT